VERGKKEGNQTGYFSRNFVISCPVAGREARVSPSAVPCIQGREGVEGLKGTFSRGEEVIFSRVGGK